MRLRSFLVKTLLLLCVAVVPLFWKLGYYHIQPTADLWIHRSSHFAEHIIKGDFANTVLQYHPGITVMWAVGAGITVFNNICDVVLGTRPDVFSVEYFPLFFFAAKFPVVLMNLGLLILSFFLVKKLFGRKVAWVCYLLLLLEPFMLANVRSLHLDAPLTLFAFNTFLFLLNAVSSNRPTKTRKVFYLLTGVFLGLSILTKTTNLFLIPVIGAVLLLYYKKDLQNMFKVSLLIFTTAVATFWLLNPAMWVTPLETIRLVFYEGIFQTGLGDVGTSLLHNVEPSGLLYRLGSYPITVLYRASPFLILGIIIAIWYKKSTSKMFLFWNGLAIFCGVYLALMIIPGKKIYRYVLPLFPPLILMASWGIVQVFEEVRKHKKLLWGGFGVLLYGQALLFLPYSFAYFNPLLGGLWGASKVVNMKQDGAGYFEVTNYLNQKENSQNLTVACYDWIPLGMVFFGETQSIRRTEAPIVADYILLPAQYGDEYVEDIYKLEKTFKVFGFKYWRLYRKSGV